MGWIVTSLDNIWNKLYENKNPISTSEFIKVLGELGGKELANECNRIVHGKKSIFEEKSIFEGLK